MTASMYSVQKHFFIVYNSDSLLFKLWLCLLIVSCHSLSKCHSMRRWSRYRLFLFTFLFSTSCLLFLFFLLISRWNVSCCFCSWLLIWIESTYLYISIISFYLVISRRLFIILIWGQSKTTHLVSNTFSESKPLLFLYLFFIINFLTWRTYTAHQPSSPLPLFIFKFLLQLFFHLGT